MAGSGPNPVTSGTIKPKRARAWRHLAKAACASASQAKASDAPSFSPRNTLQESHPAAHLARLPRPAQPARVINLIRRHASLMVIGAIAAAAAAALGQRDGAHAVGAALHHAWELFLFIAPSLLAGLLLAAALRQLVSPGALARWMGAESDWFGLAVATLAGALTPGGPMAAFPLVLVLAGAGADRGALVAYILSWALNGFQKLLVYEVPLLGPDFAIMRTIITLPMPMLAGWVARRLPIAWEPPK